MIGLQEAMLYLCVRYLGRHPSEIGDEMHCAMVRDLAVVAQIDREMQAALFGEKPK